MTNRDELAMDILLLAGGVAVFIHGIATNSALGVNLGFLCVVYGLYSIYRE